MEKTGNRAEEQDNESTYSFQSYDSRRLLMFLCQGWYSHKEKETLLCEANFGLPAISCSKSGQRGAPPVPVAFTKKVFSFLDRMVLFLSSLGQFFFLSSFFHFFTRDFLPLLIFLSIIEFCDFFKVRDVNKICEICLRGFPLPELLPFI